MHKLAVLFFIACTALPVYGEELDKQKASANDFVQKAYEQMRHDQFDTAVPLLCEAIKLERNNVSARRYLAFALVEQGQLNDALEQLKLLDQIDNQNGFSPYMRGVVLEKMGEPTRAADCYSAAVKREPKNDYFRKRAINSLIMMSRYDDASALCLEGVKLSTDMDQRKFYDNQLKHTRTLSAYVSKNRPCMP
jgi:tetratricopeptide (TPR) repeat protein